MRVYRPMTVCDSVPQAREDKTSRAAKHRPDEPTKLSLSMVASLQSLLSFRLVELL